MSDPSPTPPMIEPSAEPPQDEVVERLPEEKLPGNPLMSIILVVLFLVISVGFMGWLSTQPSPSLKTQGYAITTPNSASYGSTLMKTTSPYQFVNPPSVGSKVSEFSSVDTTGKFHRLSDILLTHSVFLLFYTGDSAPQCRDVLTELQAQQPSFVNRGIQVLAVSGDPIEIAQKTLTDLKLTYPLLVSPTNPLIDGFNVRDPANRNQPWPVALWIDDSQTVRWLFLRENRQRVSISQALTEIDGLLKATPSAEARP